MRRTGIAPFLAVPLFLSACVRCDTAAAPDDGVVIMSYNLQTLFDPVDQGGEYDGFVVADGDWSEALYRSRIEALASAVLAAAPPGGAKAAAPDVLVVQEAENARALRDLAEALGGYEYALSSPDEEATLSCGILSRFPVTAFRAHRVRKPDASPSSVPRYLLEAELDAGGRRLVIIAAHLKSKLGGAEETEPERASAAAFVSSVVAARLAADPTLAVVVAGDFNENPDERERVEAAYPTALMPAESGPGPWLLISGDRSSLAPRGGQPVLFCPWDESGGYSYRYDGVDERIDQLLLSPGPLGAGDCPWSYAGFSAEPPEFAVDDDGTPLGWRSGSGYSDHLPIRLLLSPSP